MPVTLLSFRKAHTLLPAVAHVIDEFGNNCRAFGDLQEDISSLDFTAVRTVWVRIGFSQIAVIVRFKDQQPDTDKAIALAIAYLADCNWATEAAMKGGDIKVA